MSETKKNNKPSVENNTNIQNKWTVKRAVRGFCGFFFGGGLGSFVLFSLIHWFIGGIYVCHCHEPKYEALVDAALNQINLIKIICTVLFMVIGIVRLVYGLIKANENKRNV